MYIDARDADVRLAEPYDLTRFSVVADDLQTLTERAEQFGYVADGSAFVRGDWIRASGPERENGRQHLKRCSPSRNRRDG
ncbi:hypothetical protein [Streptomyces melanosporofaciens]|uniref:Uncharacterized protein n=1 Tax=Streptomyces melanosporofaciens TaxID=67327 RepID=A0A1H4KFV2_STRMJ|nr:hypothetical protein [Streptomyces melanosporofaciens]SEB57253.1 hypothetical protein SAMN04490356_0676 [Streptomyces melanosporofaciens]